MVYMAISQVGPPSETKGKQTARLDRRLLLSIIQSFFWNNPLGKRSQRAYQRERPTALHCDINMLNRSPPQVRAESSILIAARAAFHAQ